MKVLGDPVLATHMRESYERHPEIINDMVRRKIRHTVHLATALNRNKLKKNQRVVELECGHIAITENVTRMQCSDCLRIILEGLDFEAFNNGRIACPLREFHQS